MLYLELLFQGIVQGSIYALIALGLTLVYGLLRILHVAHAALFTLGGYLGVLITNATGSFALAMAASMLIVGFAGMAVYKLAYEPLLCKPPFISLIASIALFIASEEIFRIIFGPYGLSYTNPPLQGYFELFGGFYLKHGEALVIGLSVVMLSLLGWLSGNTRLGVSWRATVKDPAMARAFGINIQNVRYMNFFIGSALAASAGVLVALLNNLGHAAFMGVGAYTSAMMVKAGVAAVLSVLPLWIQIVEDYKILVYSALLFFMMRWAPDGLTGILRRSVKSLRGNS
ncbi:MAG: branched-chain amino acid ABC transporter permease [Paracoccaceae bacterium]